MNSITLQEPAENNIAVTYAWIQQKDLKKYFMLKETPSYEQHLQYFKKLKTDASQKFFCIYSGKKYIGNCGLKYLDTGQPELWIYIGDIEERKKGCAFSACKELLKYFQQNYFFSYIKLHVAKDNTPAINLYKKLGFEFSEATDADKEIWKERIDLVYAMRLNLNKAAMMQPTFLPWMGFFELIDKADTFIFLDDFQFSAGSFHNRNRLFVNKEQVKYLTLPVGKKHFFMTPLNQLPIQVDSNWKEQFIRTVTYNYRKTPFFAAVWERLLSVLTKEYHFLAEINMALIAELCSLLGIEKKFLLSSDIDKSGQRSELVYNILKSVQASCYFSAFGSFEYMLEDKIFPCEIPVVFQNHIPKRYKQFHSKEFVPYLSVLDALFNIGPEQTLAVIRSGTEKWLTWDERLTIYKEQHYE